MIFASRKYLLLLGVALLASSMQAVCSLAAEESPASVDETDAAEPPTCGSAICEGKAFVEDVVVDIELAPPVIPDFTNGGILVYFHLYKTGGSSITELVVETKADLDEALQDDEEEMIVFVNNREDMTNEDIEESISMVKDKGKTVFYNFHVEFPSTMYPTLVEAAPVLDMWREAAKAQGVPFFLTTVLREPVGHALSFFNFFHVAVDEEEWSPFTGDLEPTEENFLKTYAPNRLCHLMYDDAHGILEAPDFALREGLLENLKYFMDEEEMDRRNEPSHCDADVVRKVLFGGTFDYVGVTERLSTHILPMFTQIIFGDHELAKVADKKKDITEMFEEDEMPPLKKNKLSESTKEKIAKESSKDQQLYEEARDRFAHWPSYL
jgi:hypothetical protein